MTESFPSVDARRAKELYTELRAVADAAMPEWRRSGDGEFGEAFAQIVARLGEHLTQRMDQTPLRDMTAFYNLLDMPADWSRPAQAPLVFQLTDNRQADVFAPAGVQVAASTDNGDVVFETRSSVKLTPARLEFLAIADAASDLLEASPPNFLTLAPREGQQPDYKLVTFAAAGSKTLQIAPEEGLEPANLIRISGIVYRITKSDEGLFTLDEPLETNAEPKTSVEKVSQFDTLRMRNLQRHSVYIGHKELFQLTKLATIRLSFEPVTVAPNIIGQDYRWELFGTKATEEEPDWHELLAEADGGQVVLQKIWEGSVEETEINGEKSRWLRLVRIRKAPILANAVLNTRTRAISICLKTLDAENMPRPVVDSCKPLENIAEEPPLQANSADTISQAYYNATPLPLTTRFLPFGSEPKRFDIFSLAAPEAFSKPGATAFLDVVLAGAGISTITAVRTQTNASLFRAYAAGTSGELSTLVFAGGQLNWQPLNAPGSDGGLANTAILDTVESTDELLLVSDIPVDALNLRNTSIDIILAQDLGKRSWIRLVLVSAADNQRASTWFLVPERGTERLRNVVILGESKFTRRIHLLGQGADNKLYQMSLQIAGLSVVFDSGWNPFPRSNVGSNPLLRPDVKLTFVDRTLWPNAPGSILADILVVDQQGKLWLAGVTETRPSVSVPTAPFPPVPPTLNVSWKELNVGSLALNIGLGGIFSPIEDNQNRLNLSVFAAQGLDERTATLVSVVVDNAGTPLSRVFPEPPVIISSDTTLGANSAIQVFSRAIEPLAGFFYKNENTGKTLAEIWTLAGVKETVPIQPSQLQASEPTANLLGSLGEAQPSIISVAKDETVGSFRLPVSVEYELFYGAAFDTIIDLDAVLIKILNDSSTEILASFASRTTRVIDLNDSSVDVYQVNKKQVDQSPSLWGFFTSSQTFIGQGCRPLGDNRLQLAEDPDNDIVAGSALNIAGQVYYVEGDVIPEMRIAETNTDLPPDNFEYRILFTGDSVIGEPNKMDLDTLDSDTVATNILAINEHFLFVKEKNNNQVTLVLSLAMSSDVPTVDYISSGDIYTGTANKDNGLLLASTDMTTNDGDELVIDNRNYLVANKTGNEVTLELALPAKEDIEYQVLGDSDNTKFTGDRKQYNRMNLDGRDNLTGEDSVLLIEGLQFTVKSKGADNTLVVLEPGIFPLPEGPLNYDNTGLSNFNGKRYNNQLVILDENDQITAVGVTFLIESMLFPITDTVECERLVALVDQNGNDKSLPASAGNTFEYKLLTELSPAQPVLKNLYKITNTASAIDIDIAATVDRLRYVPVTDTVNPVIQEVLYRKVSAGDTWFMVANSQPVSADTGIIDLLTPQAQQWQSISLYDFQNPELSWEYFDGKSWQSLEEQFIDRTLFFAKSGTISFIVPDDLSLTEVAGKEDYWIRARLVGGDYGRPIYSVETITDPADPNKSTQEVKVNTDRLNPPEIVRITASFELVDKTPPQHLLVENNLDFRIQTQANREASAEFELFEGVLKINREAGSRLLYFGFNKPFNISPLSIYIDAEDQDQQTDLVFDVLARDDNWLRLSADDQTNGMHRRGIIQVSVNSEPRKSRLFGQERFWLRARPKSGDTGWAPQLKGVYLNAVDAWQARTFDHEVLGSSLGEPGLVLRFGNIPVLPSSLELRVRETLGEEEQDALNAEVSPGALPTVTQYPELSLAGDWVRWQRVDSFVGRGAEERIFRLNTETGQVTFGNDRQGRIPPAGADNVRAIKYQTGGGLEGNLPAFTIKGLKSAVESLDQVANPVPATGGTETPGLPEQLLGAPAAVRRSGQALTPPDIEALVVASSPDLVRARAFYPQRIGDPIQVVIAQRSGERCPQASLAQRNELARLVREQAWGGLVEHDLHIINPQYIKIALRIRLIALTSRVSASLEQRATERLRRFFHPIEGGPLVGSVPGWSFGRTVYPSDIYRVLVDLPELDRVAGIDQLTAKNSANLVSVPPAGLICADEADIQVSVEFAQEALES